MQSDADVNKALQELGQTKGYAVKAQVHTGGRGLGYFKENNFKGGVQVVTTPQYGWQNTRNQANRRKRASLQHALYC